MDAAADRLTATVDVLTGKDWKTGKGAQLFFRPGDTLTVSTTASSASLLRAQTNTDFDNQGRVYRTYVYSVDPSSGALSSTALVTNTFYDHRNNVIEVIPPNGPATENAYGGAGRLVHTYTVVQHNDRSSEIGTYNSSTGTFYLDSNHDYTYDTGDATDPWASSSAAIPVIGDWNGSGTTKIGTFNPLYNTWYLDTNGDATFDTGDYTYTSFHPGGSSEIPVVGDWTGDGKTKIGMYDPATGTWYLDLNGNGNGSWDTGDVSFTYNPTSSSSATPVVGDWTGDGVSKVGIFLSGTWYLDKNNNHTWDGASDGDGYSSGQFGTASGALPIVGDWSGDGVSKIGSYYVGTWYVDVNNDYTYDTGDTTYSWGGAPGASPQTGTYVPSYDGSWSYAGTVSNAIVLSQTDNTYDSNGNVILVAQHERFDNDSTSAYGALGTATSGLGARTSYVASYFDGADRLTYTVDVGTNGGSSYTRPSSVPARSDTVLVTSQVYNNAGWVSDVIDPRGIDNQTLYDALGRTTETIADYTGSGPTASSDQTTAYTYDGDNHTLTVTVQLPSSAIQETQYVYGVSTSAGSYVNSNDLLATTEYPDPSTGSPSTSTNQEESYTYNAFGQVLTYKDRNGTVHAYTYDVLNRLIRDTITTLGSGVDGSVRRIDTAYDSQGNAYLVTSYSDTAGTTVVNQVETKYNGLGQLTNDYQAHSGSVNTSTTPQVQYAYSLMAGGANTSRLTSMTYPNGKVLTYNYNVGTSYGGNIDNYTSRLSSLSDSTGTVEALTYLGFSTVVQQVDGPTELTYISQTGSTGDAGDRYTGLDRFGRVAEQLWQTSGGSPTTTDDFIYGFDRDSNALYKLNNLSSGFSELYHANGSGNGYDGLNRIVSWNQGTLNSSHDTISSPTNSESYTMDAVGNFTTVVTNGSTVTETANQQNEITGVSGSTTPVYDHNGNMATDQNGNTLKYDAWNRLVQVKNSGGTTLISYTYDGLGRRITETRGSTTTDLYYSNAGQVLEERVSGTALYQYMWSPTYVNALVLRDQLNSDGSLNQRLWVQQDANYNVTALVNSSGTVVERYTYDPYGAATVLTGSWGSRSGSSYSWVYTFQDGRSEPLTGDIAFGERFYAPVLRIWLSADPMRFFAGQVSFYGFVGDNPVNGRDPSGLDNTDTGPTSLPDFGPNFDRRFPLRERGEQTAEWMKNGGSRSYLPKRFQSANSKKVLISSKSFVDAGLINFPFVPAKDQHSAKSREDVVAALNQYADHTIDILFLAGHGARGCGTKFESKDNDPNVFRLSGYSRDIDDGVIQLIKDKLKLPTEKTAASVVVLSCNVSNPDDMKAFADKLDAFVTVNQVCVFYDSTIGPYVPSGDGAWITMPPKRFRL